jgi:hypothetical protein
MILVTGSRNWKDAERIHRFFDAQDRSHKVVYENLPGASSLAAAIASDLGFKVERRTTKRLLTGKAALVVGFWDGKDKRARLVLDAALKQDIDRRMVVIYPTTRL